MNNCPKAAIFDLDNTLAEPHQPLSDSMLPRVRELLSRAPTLAIMSAASLERMHSNVLSRLDNEAHWGSLVLFTANASQCYLYRDGAWRAQYQFGFSPEEIGEIEAALEDVSRETGAIRDTPLYGPQFVNYEGYIAFTALGLGAPEKERKAWDPDLSKRHAMRKLLLERIPEFDVYIGGSTSIDITPKGINKAYGVRWLSDHLACAPSEMLYVGDALYEGGNDAVVITTGIQTRSVSSPSETAGIIDELIAACSAA